MRRERTFFARPGMTPRGTGLPRRPQAFLLLWPLPALLALYPLTLTILSTGRSVPRGGTSMQMFELI